MPISWDITGYLLCDAEGCERHLTVAGDTQAEAVRWIRQAKWTYRWSTITGERRLVVRCPDHPESLDEEDTP
jgi:hypothetical protein